MSRWLIVLFHVLVILFFTNACKVKPNNSLKAILDFPSTSINSGLFSLSISSGTIIPSFSNQTFSYTVDVANNVSTVTITPTAFNLIDTISVNGSVVVTGNASSNIPLAFGANVITIRITSLTSSATYTVTVTRPASNNYRIFVTNSLHNGDFASGFSNWRAGADEFCRIDLNKPDNNLIIFKALMVDSGNTRRACNTANCTGGVSENIGWVLKPSTSYIRATDNLPLFTTNSSGIFTTGLSNSFGAGLVYWTGFSSGNNWVASATNECSSWSTSGGGTNGRNGDGNSSVGYFNALVNITQACSNTNRILCVEQ